MNKSPEIFSKQPQEELPPGVEAEKVPHYFIMITRHAERLPSGELSPEGIAHSKAKGEELKDVEVLKSYASDHPSGRTYETAENIGQEANIKSPLTGKYYKIRKVKGIQYDALDPAVLKEAKLLIEEATLDEIYHEHPELAQLIDAARNKDTTSDLIKPNSKGEPMINIEKLPKDIQKQIAPIRQKHQRSGFEKILNNPDAVKSMAMGLSHQLSGKEKILARYSKYRDKKRNPPKKDVVINISTHAMFIESLLKNAGIFVKPNGEEIHGIDSVSTDGLGGYIQPAESVCLDMGPDPNDIPERIPVVLEKGREITGKIYIDRAKLEQLGEDYSAREK